MQKLELGAGNCYQLQLKGEVNMKLTIWNEDTEELRTAGEHTGIPTRRETIAVIAASILESGLSNTNSPTGLNGWKLYEGDPEDPNFSKLDGLPAPSQGTILELMELIHGPNPPQ